MDCAAKPRIVGQGPRATAFSARSQGAFHPDAQWGPWSRGCMPERKPSPVSPPALDPHERKVSEIEGWVLGVGPTVTRGVA